ncbi:MAG: dehydrogenase [Agarilytica sp.]
MNPNLPQHSDSYQAYHLDLLQQLEREIKQQPPFDEASESLRGETEQTFLAQLHILNDSNTPPEQRNQAGQNTLLQIVASYQHLMVLVPRSLFWYFGGECLHYLGDEELSNFQKLEEAYFEALDSGQGVADYAQLIALVAKENSGKTH